MADSGIAIKVENLSKKFCKNLRRSMYYGSLDIFRNMIGLPSRTDNLRKHEFWALDNVSFELKRGEILGVIGINGSGKSTLLRVLSGIFPPDSGRIEIRGNVGSLIAVGAGFHPHMTGRENIYLNGTILGMSRIEIKQKFDEIVDFAEIGDFLDAPVATYSSGMKVRLGFSIAIHRVPEILLIDEVLAVGDASFKKKCMNKMQEIARVSSIIFISHNMYQIERICDRVILLHGGRIHKEGTREDVISEYYRMTISEELKGESELSILDKTDDIEQFSLNLTDDDNQQRNVFKYGETIRFNFDFVSRSDFENAVIGFVLMNSEGIYIGGAKNINHKNDNFRDIHKGRNRFTIALKNAPLLPNSYRLHLKWKRSDNVTLIDAIGQKFAIETNPDFTKYDGIIKLNDEWFRE